MELPVAVQLRELGWALALGLGLGLLNELLRLLRRGRGGTALADLLWCLALLTALLAFPLYAGNGRLRAADLLAMGLSGGLWTAMISFVRRRYKNRRKNCKNFAKTAKKVLHFAKNLLQ